MHAVVNKQNNRFIEPADFEDERPSLDAYLGTDREYYAQDDYYQVPEAVLSNADKLRNKYLKMLAQTSFVRAKDPASFLEPAKDPSITTVTMTTTTTSTTTSTMAPVNTDTIIQKVETISISKNNNEEVKTETVTVVEEKKEKPDVKMEEFKDKAPVLSEKLPEYRYEQVTEIKIVTSTTPGNSNNNTPKQPTKSTKNQNKNKLKNNKKVEPVEEQIEFEWVGDESESEEDEDDIVIDEDIEEDDEEDEEDDLSDIDVVDLIVEDDDEEDDEDDEEDEEDEDESEEDMPVQYVFDRNSGLSKKEVSKAILITARSNILIAISDALLGPRRRNEATSPTSQSSPSRQRVRRLGLERRRVLGHARHRVRRHDECFALTHTDSLTVTTSRVKRTSNSSVF